MYLVTVMNIAYLLTGANLGDRERNLAEAREQISKNCGKIIKSSSLYETAAWGNTDQPAFLNQALQIETSYNARKLMRRILKVENMMGRVRKEKYGPRIIDIDILLFNDETHEYPLLRLPHPELPNRRFALVPLVELIPGHIHPVLQRTISELLLDCRDNLPVKKYS